MIKFILNNEQISYDIKSISLLNFIRSYKKLTGTKAGCETGECGSCSVLVGELINDKLIYRTMVSCLVPLNSVHGKHIVTIEGINQETLNPIQQSIVDNGATQCGFCTSGYVIAFTGFLLGSKNLSYDDAISAISRNICRCTGYKPIERATIEIVNKLNKLNKTNMLKSLIKHNYLPTYFLTIENKLRKISTTKKQFNNNFFTYLDDECHINSAITTGALYTNNFFKHLFLKIKNRNNISTLTEGRERSTLARMIEKSSSNNDLLVFLLSLNATVVVNNGIKKFEIKLSELYRDNATRISSKHIKSIHFSIPQKNSLFHFEKIGRTKDLDTSSVNSAINMAVKEGIIQQAILSAGGVFKKPLYLRETSSFLLNKKISNNLVIRANEFAQKEISPTSNIRGTENYRRLLLRQQIWAHFLSLFPKTISKKLF